MAAPYTQGGGGGPAPIDDDNSNHALDKPYDLYGDMTPDKMQQLNEMFDLLFKSTTKSAEDITTINDDITNLGTGDVVGPSVAVSGDIALFDGITGKLIKDSAILGTNIVQGPASAVSGNLATFADTTGKLIQDGGTFATAFAAALANGVGLGLATGTLTASQLDTLSVTPVQVIPAAGAGKIILPIFFMAVGKIPTGSTWTGGGAYTLRFTGSVTNLTSGAATNFNRSGPATSITQGEGAGSTAAGFVVSTFDPANKGIDMFCSANLIPSGSGAGTMDYWIWYALASGVVNAT